MKKIMEFAVPLGFKASLGFQNLVSRLRRQEGQSMAEYGLLIGLIAIVVIVAVRLLGTTLLEKFNTVADELKK